MRSSAFSVLAALSIDVFCAPPAPVHAAPQNHPLIQPYTGSVLARRDDVGHSEYKVVTALNPSGKTDDEIIQTIPATGNLTRLFYENPTGKSPLEIIANYKDALQDAGFQVIFECGDKECGPSWASSRWGRVNGMSYVSSPMWYLAAKRRTDDAEAYVALAVTKVRHQIDILEAKAMDRGQVTVTAEALKTGLAANGKVVLDGLYFDHDKATLKPESKPALEVIAQFLVSDPALNVYIVGHTDAAGTFEYNMNLSQDRAKSVVDALIADHKIAAKRLTAHGVGPLCPSKTNRSDAGKAENRRVEMVAR
jgi:outer membrane protein OmpA-like peptidoglycan-associated protein